MKTIHGLMRATMASVLVIIGTSLVMHDAAACTATTRSSTERARFVRANACPSTGLTYGSCQGYIVDHIVPLCKGGSPKAANMQWQTVANAAAKDKVECKGVKR